MNAKRIQNNDDEGVPAKNVEFIKKNFKSDRTSLAVLYLFC